MHAHTHISPQPSANRCACRLSQQPRAPPQSAPAGAPCSRRGLLQGWPQLIRCLLYTSDAADDM
eukprot:4130803-Alexandrium_andersonii.AAC.1